jgi:predicted metal-dependent hydrolase
MATKLHTINYGTQQISFQLERRERKTLAIHVHPDMSIEVVAPLDASLEQIYEKVKKRARWIERQVGFFRQFHPKTPARQYMAGETHRYLGRQYRLKLIPDDETSVKIARGYIIVYSKSPKDPETTRKLVEDWFFKRAKIKFRERLGYCLQLFPDPEVVHPIGMIVRQLSNRWGSMSPAGRLVLNYRLIQAPTWCIDYVIVHELCHRIYANHGPHFEQLLERIMPDWEERKLRLEQMMA